MVHPTRLCAIRVRGDGIRYKHLLQHGDGGQTDDVLGITGKVIASVIRLGAQTLHQGTSRWNAMTRTPAATEVQASTMRLYASARKPVHCELAWYA